MLVKHDKFTTLQIAKRFFYLAYQNSRVYGSGWLRAQNNVTEEDVWNNVCNAGDYPANFVETNKPYADYVFGRMMKVGLSLNEDGSIEVRDEETDTEYQSWGHKYKTTIELMNATILSLEEV